MLDWYVSPSFYTTKFYLNSDKYLQLIWIKYPFLKISLILWLYGSHFFLSTISGYNDSLLGKAWSGDQNCAQRRVPHNWIFYDQEPLTFHHFIEMLFLLDEAQWLYIIFDFTRSVEFLLIVSILCKDSEKPCTNVEFLHFGKLTFTLHARNWPNRFAIDF